jgi:hypothetical protein
MNSVIGRDNLNCSLSSLLQIMKVKMPQVQSHVTTKCHPPQATSAVSDYKLRDYLTSIKNIQRLAIIGKPGCADDILGGWVQQHTSSYHNIEGQMCTMRTDNAFHA